MQKKTILICGSTGFVGRNMLEYFGKSSDYKIRATYNIRPPYDVSHLSAEVEWCKVDLRNSDQVEEIVQGVDYIIQAAATTSGAKDIVSKPYIHVTDNVIMNSLLLRFAFHANVKHFIFFSCTVMYQSSEKALSETDWDSSQPLHPRYYGVGNTKIYIEKMLEFFSNLSEMKTTAIRHSNIYGPHDKYDFDRSHVFGATISKVMLADEKVTVWGTGEEERDLLHVNDLCDFVDKAINNQQHKFRLYNCGLGKKISIRNLVELIVNKSGKNLEIVHDTTQPTIKTSLFLDNKLANQELSWFPTVDLEQGVECTINWWRDNIDENTLQIRKK